MGRRLNVAERLANELRNRGTIAPTAGPPPECCAPDECDDQPPGAGWPSTPNRRVVPRDPAVITVPATGYGWVTRWIPRDSKPAEHQHGPALCNDCAVEVMPLNLDQPSQLYMVTGEVGAQSGLGPNDGCLCIGCLEDRIGRELTGADFPMVPLNLPMAGMSTPRLEALQWAALRSWAT